MRSPFRVLFLFVAFVLSTTAVMGFASAGAQRPDLAALFGLDVKAIDTAFREAVPPAKTWIGLVRADLLGTSSPEAAVDSLERLDVALLGSDGEAYGKAIRCAAFFRLGRLEEAQQQCDEAENKLDSLDDPFLRARILSSLHLLAIRHGRLKEALELAHRAVRAARDSDSPYLEATALNACALTFAFSGLHGRAIDYFEEARRRLRGFEDRPLDKMVTFNLGLAYRESGDPERALEAFRQGFEWATSTGQAHRELIARVEMANALNELGRPRDGLALLEPAIENPEAKHDPDTLLHAMLALSRARLELGEGPVALRHVTRGLELADDHANPHRKRELVLARAEVLWTLGRREEAVADLGWVIAASKAADSSKELVAVLDVLSRLEADLGDREGAYEHLIEARLVAEAARGRAFERKLTLFEVSNRLETADRERRLAEARAETLSARTGLNRTFAVGGVSAGALGLFALFLDRQRRREHRHMVEERRNAELLEKLVEQRTRALEEQLTERMRGDEEKRALEQQLAESDKLRALGQLTGGVAHDFNNLLTVVSGATELLEQGQEMSAAERSELIGAIQEAAATGREINQGLLAYARRQPLNPERIVLQDFFERQRLLFERTLGGEMVLEISTRPLTILADWGQLSTAIINLLTNAREASASRGVVSIIVRSGGEAAGPTAVIEVRDHGRGMTEAEAARSIEPFYSTKETTIATGLGLSRVYGFAQQSGGRMKITSEPGKGTTVTLEFPVTTDGEGSDALVADIDLGELRVLLVDDNRAVRGMVTRMLTSLGHVASTAANGEQALQMIEEEAPDLLITDVLMPGKVGGVELAHAARERRPEVAILMISGFAEAPELEFPLLSKPFRLADLDRALRTLFANGER